MYTEKIIREWFYRLPKGYAQPPYTQEELDVLQEVLAQYNDIKNSVPSSIETLTERTSPISDITSLVKKLDDKQLELVRTYIVSIGFYNSIMPYLASKGIVSSAYQIGDRAVQLIFDRIANLPDVTKVIEYFKDPPNLQYDQASGIGNIVDASGLPDRVIFELMQIQPGADAGGNATGPAEIALSLLFSDVTNKQGGGDLEYKGRTLEVKGKDARLGTQSRTKASLDSSFLSYILDKAVSDSTIEEQDYIDFFADTDHRNIAIALRDAYQLLTKAGYSEQELIKQYQKGISAIYFENRKVVDQYLNNETNFNKSEDIALQLTKINLEAYMEKIGVDIILFHNFRPNKPDYSFILVPKESINSIVDAGVIRLGSSTKREGSIFWHDSNPGVKLLI